MQITCHIFREQIKMIVDNYGVFMSYITVMSQSLDTAKRLNSFTVQAIRFILCNNKTNRQKKRNKMIAARKVRGKKDCVDTPRIDGGKEGGEEMKKGSKETLRESKRSEKHETRISLSITYALNPEIYASGINARRSTLSTVTALALKYMPPLYATKESNTVRAIVSSDDPKPIPSRGFRTTHCIFL